MDKKQNQNNISEEFAEDLNLDQNGELEIDVNRHRNGQEFSEHINFNRNQINHNRES